MKKTFGILLVAGLIAIITVVVFAHGMTERSSEGNTTQPYMMDHGMMGTSMMQHMMGGMNNSNCLQSRSANPVAFADKLGLSEDQQKKISGILSSNKKDMIKKNADREIMEADLSELTQQDQPDQDAIEKQVQKIADIEAGIRYSQIKASMDVKSVLTGEQRNLLTNIQKGTNVPMMGARNPEYCDSEYGEHQE